MITSSIFNSSAKLRLLDLSLSLPTLQIKNLNVAFACEMNTILSLVNIFIEEGDQLPSGVPDWER